ncbi:MAG: GH3 auxin-responsive promoter family protein [Chloroflexi bacterium]|nr:GH3 auxin-responsive promoter family protein [Chloroflexota bacterium]
MALPHEATLEQDAQTVWQKYCGFLDISLKEFKEIQEQLLMEQLEIVSSSPLGRRLLRGSLPQSVAEFRRIARLTKYGDYLPDLENGNNAALPKPSDHWAHTTGARGDLKFVPYTQQGYDWVADNLLSAFILSCASKRGDVNIKQGDRVLYNTPPRPFLSGMVTFSMADRFGFKGVLDPRVSEAMEFKERIEKGFEEALSSGVDVLVSMTSILVKIGDGFANRSRNRKLSPSMLRPAVLFRLAKAYLRSIMQRRSILPKDLWPVKSVLGWGMDTRYFREQVAYYWGKPAYEFYACTEGGIMAMQGWNKKGMTPVPYSDFYEFIPEEESLRSWEDVEYKPTTLLLDELEPGKRYEIVITNFHGMPFLRYRVGHLIRVVALEDAETGIRLPQFEFEARCDDRIDLAGFTRLDEKTVWEALDYASLPYSDWIVRKEYVGANPYLHLYAEFKGEIDPEMARRVLDDSLRQKDPFYADLENMLEFYPLKVTCLSPGTFDRYYDEKREQGLSLTERRPLRMSALDSSVEALLRLSDAHRTQKGVKSGS